MEALSGSLGYHKSSSLGGFENQIRWLCWCHVNYGALTSLGYHNKGSGGGVGNGGTTVIMAWSLTFWFIFCLISNKSYNIGDLIIINHRISSNDFFYHEVILFMSKFEFKGLIRCELYLADFGRYLDLKIHAAGDVHLHLEKSFFYILYLISEKEQNH